MYHYATAIFLGAFLLFQIQPMVGKLILPWFGGTPAVWTTCMLFFEVLLLGGYLYAHWLTQVLSQRWQVMVHLLLLALALLALPMTLRINLRPVGGADPVPAILVLLAANVGLPYLVLSATSPLLQVWFGLARPGVSPYPLYALSNLGSLLALVSYPFVIEPALALRTQATLWAVGFAGFAVLCGYCAVRTWHLAPATAGAGGDGSPAAEAPPGWAAMLLWLGLSACGSALLLAVTNQLCWDVAVVPFLWVLPLTLYLLTFILCFQSARWYVRPVVWPLLAVAVWCMTWLWTKGVDAAIWKQVLGFCGGMFICCMACHGELVRLKPGPRYLTRFYLLVAAGGALGGVLVTLVAPRLFRSYFELHLAIWTCCALTLAAFWLQWHPLRRRVPLWQFSGVLGLTMLPLAFLAQVLSAQAQRALADNLFLERNFYGVLRVREYEEMDPTAHYLSLQHGRISHGIQFTWEGKRRLPTTYYGEKSGIGLAIRQFPRKSPLRVGVVGLGTGTIAAYGTQGDTYRFYDINPLVASLATTVFHYLSDSPARCEIVLGDARLSLEREPPGQLDILALDAFTGDAIPVHLLTREAFAVYRKCLKPDGVLAVHVSNRYLRLEPVVLAAADDLGMRSVLIDSRASDDDTRVYTSDWVLVTNNHPFLALEAIRQAATPAGKLTRRRCLWTDDFSNIFQIVKY